MEFNQFLAQRRAAIGGIVQAAYATTGGAATPYVPPAVNQPGAPAFGPAVPTVPTYGNPASAMIQMGQQAAAMTAARDEAMRAAAVQTAYGTSPMQSAAAMGADPASIAAVQPVQPSAIDLAVQAAYANHPAYGSVAPTSVDPIPGATDPQGYKLTPAVPDVWGGRVRPVENPAALVTGFGGVPDANFDAFMPASEAPVTYTPNKIGSVGDQSGWGSTSIGGAIKDNTIGALPYIDKPRQFNAGQVGEAIYDIANGNASSPRALALEALIGDHGPVYDGIVADKDQIIALYTQGTDMGGHAVVDPATGQVTQAMGERVDGGRAVWEKYFQAKVDDLPAYLRIPFRLAVDTAIDPLTYALPGSTKAGEALVHSGESLAEQAARGAAARRAAEEAATVASKAATSGAEEIAPTLVRDAAGNITKTATVDVAQAAADNAAAAVAPEIVPSAGVGPLSGAEAFTLPSAAEIGGSAKVGPLSGADAAVAVVKLPTPAEITAAREIMQKTAGYLLQATGQTLRAPQEILDAVAKIVVGGPIGLVKAVLGDLSAPTQETINNAIRRDATTAAKEVAAAPEQQIWNAARTSTEEIPSSDVGGFTQAEKDWRREANRTYEAGGTASLEPIGDPNPPKRWTPGEVQAENPGWSLVDATVEANRRNAVGPRARFDAANDYAGRIDPANRTTTRVVRDADGTTRVVSDPPTGTSGATDTGGTVAASEPVVGLDATASAPAPVATPAGTVLHDVPTMPDSIKSPMPWVNGKSDGQYLIVEQVGPDGSHVWRIYNDGVGASPMMAQAAGTPAASFEDAMRIVDENNAKRARLWGSGAKSPPAADMTAAPTTPADAAPDVAPETAAAGETGSVPLTEPAPVSVGATPLEDHVTPSATADIATATPSHLPSWYVDMTPEERTAAIRKGTIRETTPYPNGTRVVDDVFRDWALTGDPRYGRFVDRYGPRSDAYEARRAAFDATWSEDFTKKKKAVQSIDRVGHTINDMVPAYVHATNGELPKIELTGAPGERVSFTDPRVTEDYLIQRAVYAADPADANKTLDYLMNSRWSNAPWRDELGQRIRTLRDQVVAIQEVDRGPVASYAREGNTVYAVHDNGDRVKVKGHASWKTAQAQVDELNAALRPVDASASESIAPAAGDAADDLVRERALAKRMAAGYKTALTDPLMDDATRAGLTARLPDIQASIHSLEDRLGLPRTKFPAASRRPTRRPSASCRTTCSSRCRWSTRSRARWARPAARSTIGRSASSPRCRRWGRKPSRAISPGWRRAIPASWARWWSAARSATTPTT